jgi:cellulose synthase/poly-beta-1,6-N-acetylglucosamine synthase-like glycosyltransferase
MTTSTLLPDQSAPARLSSRPANGPAAPSLGAPVLDVVIPVYNEEADLKSSVRRLHAHLTAEFPYPFRITVADNGSTDTTRQIAANLQAVMPEVTAVSLSEKGRGHALRVVWLASAAPVLAYMDVDLSTDLAALLPLVAPLLSGHSDVAIGTRLARGSRVVRGMKREWISRSYNLLLRSALAARFSDAQCGFKAIRRDVARETPLTSSTRTGSGSGSGMGSTSSLLSARLAATTTTWAAATVGDMSAAQLQLASGKAVMAIGGWSGSDHARL